MDIIISKAWLFVYYSCEKIVLLPFFTSCKILPQRRFIVLVEKEIVLTIHCLRPYKLWQWNAEQQWRHCSFTLICI